MCGIAGTFDTRGRREPDRALVARMAEVQFHRGPDEGGFHFEPGVGLAHRRLSIIDLSTGQQPLFNEDGSVAVVFNGEIYNFQELVPELQALGHVFHTHSDTEVIVHAWEAWGEGCVHRFRGMFAFALWDRNRETLFLARDRFGVKPLFYALLPDGTLLFGSELKALLVHPGLSRELEPQCVEDYLALGYVPEPRTIFKSALKLEPGHSLCLRRGQPLPAPREYWDLKFSLDNPLSEADACAELVERLKESVRLRMISEVPLGAFLSGGVDSSAVVAMMAGLSATPVNTCSIGFDDPAFNEVAFAAQVAERYHTHHHVEQVASDDFDLIDDLARLYDEPYADSSAIPTYRVCQLARKRVTVALSGDCGDEALAGYRRHRLHMMEERGRALLPLGVRRPLFGLLGRIYPKADWAPRMFRAKTTFEGLARDSVAAYFHTVSVLRDVQRQALYSEAFRAQLAGYSAEEVFRRHAARGGIEDPAGPDPVPGLQDLSGGGHQHQGGPRLHGPFPRGSRPADGLQAGRVALHPAVGPQAARAVRASTSSRRRWSPISPTMFCTAPRWVLPCPWRAGSVARSRGGCARRCSASGWRIRACSTRPICGTWWTTIRPGARTTAPRSGPC